MKAMSLARQIHPSPKTAHAVALAAMSRLPSAVSNQDKRIYYGGRTTKVWLSEQQILQQLVFAASDRTERSGEAWRVPPEEELLVRYIKHLVWISTRRNVFYVTLAVARLLYGFNTRETAEIYCLLADDHAKDDAYYRARKRILMDELLERFPAALHIAPRDHGEMQFEVMTPDADTRAVVEHCLEAFAPWDVSCDGDRRDPLQLMHALLHPRCFRATVMRLGWPDPAMRLRVPRMGGGLPRDHAPTITWQGIDPPRA